MRECVSLMLMSKYKLVGSLLSSRGRSKARPPVKSFNVHTRYDRLVCERKTIFANKFQFEPKSGERNDWVKALRFGTALVIYISTHCRN